MRFTFAVPIIVCAIAAPVFVATPGLARDAGASSRHSRIHHYRGYRDYSGYLDPRSGHYDLEFQRNREDFGFSGRDPSKSAAKTRISTPHRTRARRLYCRHAVAGWNRRLIIDEKP